MTEYLVVCSIFDDGDVEPTVVMGTFTPAWTPIAEVLDFCNELLAEAEKLYGRTPPAHARFWDCYPHTDS